MGMTAAQWRQTPYATSQAKYADKAIEDLLKKYGVDQYMWAQMRGPNGRPAVVLRFELAGRFYKFALEIMDAEVPEEARIRQIKRAIFYFLKGALEASLVFITKEEALFAFLELPAPDGSPGPTAYQCVKGRIGELSSGSFGGLLLGDGSCS